MLEPSWNHLATILEHCAVKERNNGFGQFEAVQKRFNYSLIFQWKSVSTIQCITFNEFDDQSSKIHKLSFPRPSQSNLPRCLCKSSQKMRIVRRKGMVGKSMIVFAHLMLMILMQMCFGGHELLHRWNETHKNILSPEELLIIQFDSRPLADYWQVSSQWNALFAKQHGHHYQYITSNDIPCTSCDGSVIAHAWCKVKAMVLVDTLASKDIKAILYLDSDAIITVNHSMTTVISYVQQDLRWNISSMPIAFNQDGPGFACKRTIGLGYRKCFNSGSILWFRHPLSSMILRRWWNAASVPFNQMKSVSRFPMDWKSKWPWEQAVLNDLYHHSNHTIMVLSFPDLPYLPWTSKKNPKSQYPTDAIEPYCFCHWPGANCFITHFCASRKQKEKMRVIYSDIMNNGNGNGTAYVPQLNLSMMEDEIKFLNINKSPLCP